MKYALVHNNVIKVGPRDWNPAFFLDYLKEIDVSTKNVPNSYSDEKSIKINDEIYIVPVEEPAFPSKHPISEQYAGPFWNVNTTLITGTYGVVDMPVDGAKSKMREILSNVRYAKENIVLKTTVQSQNVVLITTRDSRQVWQQLLLGMKDEDTINYKFNNQIWLSLSKSDVQNVYSTIHQFVQSQFDWEKAKIDSLESVSTKSELESYFSCLEEELRDNG